MGLLDDLNEDSNFISMPGARCSVCLMMTELDEPTREKLRFRFADKRVTGTSLSRVLSANGYKITEGTINRHRRGECRGAI